MIDRVGLPLKRRLVVPPVRHGFKARHVFFFAPELKVSGLSLNLKQM